MTTSLPSNSEKTRPSQFPGLSPADEDARGWRETVESLVVALILAMLIRTFEAEAFVIPTGSMAPTLMGAHKDVKCPECLFWYQAGDSERPAVQRTRIGEAVEATCPMCGYHQSFNPAERIEESTFSGDRILVNKFAYDFGNPERWDSSSGLRTQPHRFRESQVRRRARGHALWRHGAPAHPRL